MAFKGDVSLNGLVTLGSITTPGKEVGYALFISHLSIH